MTRPNDITSGDTETTSDPEKEKKVHAKMNEEIRKSGRRNLVSKMLQKTIVPILQRRIGRWAVILLAIAGAGIVIHLYLLCVCVCFLCAFVFVFVYLFQCKVQKGSL